MPKFIVSCGGIPLKVLPQKVGTEKPGFVKYRLWQFLCETLKEILNILSKWRVWVSVET